MLTQHYLSSTLAATHRPNLSKMQNKKKIFHSLVLTMVHDSNGQQPSTSSLERQKIREVFSWTSQNMEDVGSKN